MTPPRCRSRTLTTRRPNCPSPLMTPPIPRTTMWSRRPCSRARIATRTTTTQRRPTPPYQN
eukprot:7326149-Prymnesium_polylepis.1